MYTLGMYQTVCHKLSPFCCLCSLLHWPCLQIDLREVKLTPWIMNRHQDWSLSLDMASGNAAIFLWGLAMYGNAKLQTVKKKLIVRKKKREILLLLPGNSYLTFWQSGKFAIFALCIKQQIIFSFFPDVSETQSSITMPNITKNETEFAGKSRQ